MIVPNGPDDDLRDNHGCERAVSRAAARFMMRRKPWEYPTRDAMQIALAGSMPRDEYLRHRSDMARELVELFGLDGTQQVFEIGSGDGVVARHLARQCRSLDCADISRTFLDAAQETCGGLDNVRFHLITTDFLDFLPAGEYDFGYSLNVFVHLNAYDIYFYLRSVDRLLRGGGLFRFNIANVGESNRELFHRHAQVYRSHQDPVRTRGIMNWHGMDLIRALVAEAGLRFREDRLAGSGGHYKVLVEKAAV
jgi:SAM-dependent methyltransferase